MSLAVRDSDNSPSFLSHDTWGVGLKKGKKGRNMCRRDKNVRKKRGETVGCLKVRHKMTTAGRGRTRHVG